MWFFVIRVFGFAEEILVFDHKKHVVNDALACYWHLLKHGNLLYYFFSICVSFTHSLIDSCHTKRNVISIHFCIEFTISIAIWKSQRMHFPNEFSYSFCFKNQNNHNSAKINRLFFMTPITVFSKKPNDNDWLTLKLMKWQSKQTSKIY